MAVEKLEKDWIKYPILHLDLNIEKYDTPESLDKILNDNLEYWESQYGTRPSETSFSLRFAGIIQRACEKTGQRVVILVDEYDKPMLQAIGNEELQKQFLKYPEAILWRFENEGRVYKVRSAYRRDKVW